MRGTILIIDDEEHLRGALSRILELEGYRVFQAGDAKKGYLLLEQQPDIQLVITDVRLPGENGLQVLEKIKKSYPYCEVIVVTAYGTIQDGVQAMKLGAFDYVTKGDGEEQIIVTVERAVEKSRMQLRIHDLEKKLKTRYSFDKILGTSKEIKDSILLAEKVAPADSTVLLEGETGTGKELFAQSIHNASARKNKPFVAVNCSAFPKDLLESELFGYKKGAFTGANSDKKGLFEEANEGTLFLDEIGEMNFDLQAKLLRVLEDQTFTKIGDTKQLHVNVRIIAATNLDLLKEVQSEKFRADLYYRLSVFKIRLPALRERIEDVEAMAMYFIRFYSLKTNKQVTGMDTAFLTKLMRYDWPGNTRELKNIIERTVILTDHEILTSDLLPYEMFTPLTNAMAEDFGGSMEDLEKIHIRKILALAKGNKTKAAERLGIGIPTLYRKLKKYGLE
jgi:DNA-binding NtrC family response regulator